jgi:TonB-linked SusC/RagA family outer membrane protein
MNEMQRKTVSGISGISKYRKLLKLFMTVFFALQVLYVFPQSVNTVSGIVTSNTDGQPISGVSVTIKGTTTGTITDINGKYSIKASTDQEIEFSFIGFVKQTISVGSQTTLNVVLSEDVAVINEIVVIGYGVQKKKLVTGATVQVSGDDLAKQSTTNALQAMQGKTPGVQITTQSGQPGEGIKVTIRGLGTIGNSGPLYIVDGVATDNISYLNNSDIESIDILKDAASSAIYGSRAANGVVLVTTKSGKAGSKSQVTFDAYYGVQNAPKLTEMCNAKQYAELMNEQYLNSGGNATSLPYTIKNGKVVSDVNGMTYFGDTNWLDEMFVDNAVTQNYTLGITGGSETSNYSMSAGYTGTEGIVGGSDYSNYDRYNARLNSQNKVFKDVLTVGEHLNLSYVKRNGVDVGGIYANNLRGAFNTTPLLAMYRADGSGYQNSNESKTINGETVNYLFNEQANPYASMVYGNQGITDEQKLIGDLYADLTPFQGLTLHSSFGVDYYANQTRTYTPSYYGADALSVYSYNEEDDVTHLISKGITWDWNNYAKYDLSINEHELSFMAGMESRKYVGTRLYGANCNISFDDLTHAYLNNALNKDGSKITLESEPYFDQLVSYFGRVQYNYKETYMLNGTFRADGSSKFAKNNRWGYFPSLSAGWVISNEEFMAGTSSFMDFLKLRLSWGQNGNSNIGSYQYVAPISFTNASYPLGTTEGTIVNGSYPERIANTNLKWETSEQLDFGIDARFLRGKLNVTFDFYNKTTKDWLLIAPMLQTIGSNEPYINGGNVTNRGVELGLTYNDNIGDFHYTVSANGSYNNNNVTDIPTEDGIIEGSSNVLWNNAPVFYRAQTGHAIGYFWGYKTAGVINSSAQLAEYKKLVSSAKMGDLMYVDTDGNGKISSDDKTEIGDPNPDFTFGFNFSCDYKGLDFSVQANGVAGNQLVQSLRNQADQTANFTTDMYNNRWHGVGTSTKYPRLTITNENYQEFSDIYVQDGDFLRISNVTLGYTLPAFAKKNFIQKIRVYGSVQNLYTFTKYTGMDPEVGYGVYDNNDASDRFSSGIDLGYYPRPRTCLVGVNITF